MSEHLIANMRGRIEQCRRLAKATHDERARKILRDMADEIEADMQRLKEGQVDTSRAADSDFAPN